VDFPYSPERVDKIKTIPAIDGYYRCVKEGNWDRLAEILETNDFAKHADFLGYTIADEPYGGGNISAENLDRAYEIIRAADPHHAVTLVSNGSGRAARHREHVDYILLDIYPMFARQPLVTMYNEVREARKHLWPKPVIAVPEGLPCPYKWFEKNTGFGMPTRYEQMEATAFLAIAGGARGIIWFNMRYTNPEQLKWIRTIAAEKIKPLIPILLTDDLDEQATPSNDAVKTLVKRHAERYYLIAVNSKDEELADVAVALPKTWNMARIEDFYTAAPAPLKDGNLIGTYGPYETKVFRLAE